jgi:hypothetical protein
MIFMRKELYFFLLLSLTACIFSPSMEAPKNAVDAQLNIERNITRDIRERIDEQFPSLPELNAQALVTEQFDSYVDSHMMEYCIAVSHVANESSDFVMVRVDDSVRFDRLRQCGLA